MTPPRTLPSSRECACSGVLRSSASVFVLCTSTGKASKLRTWNHPENADVVALERVDVVNDVEVNVLQ